MQAPDKQETASYYNQTIRHFRLYWNLGSSKALHYGLWFRGTWTLRKALENTNREVIRQLFPAAGMHLLDAGCGVGGTAIFLAKETGAQVTGITLSEKQVNLANTYAAREGVQPLVQFALADFENTGLPPGTFDAVYAIESVCHSNAKDAFLREAYRLLKPGGKLLLFDFFRTRQQPSPNEQQALQNWLQCWAVTEIAHGDVFCGLATDAGFSSVQLHNLTDLVRPSARRLYLAYVPAAILSRIYTFFRPRTGRYAATLYRGLYWQYETLRKGLWGYGMLTAEKPAQR